MPADRLGFAQLGFDLSPRSGSSVVSFDFPFDIARLPRGTRPGSVSILMQAAEDPDGRGITTVAFLNDTMLGSNRISGGKAAWFDYDIPPGAIGRDNVLRVQILRQQRGGECTFSGQSFPAQVLAASRFNLVAAGEEAPSFHLLRQDMQQVVDLAIDPAFEDDVARLLNWSGPALASLIPPGATIRPVRELDPLAEATPFISVSITPPAGTEPRLRTDEGAVELISADGTVLFNGSDLDRLGMVQIVTLGNRRGLWLRPGAGLAAGPHSRSSADARHGRRRLSGRGRYRAGHLHRAARHPADPLSRPAHARRYAEPLPPVDCRWIVAADHHAVPAHPAPALQDPSVCRK